MSKTLKKLLCALMAVAMLFAFAACDSDKDSKDKDETEEVGTSADKGAAVDDEKEPVKDDESEIEEAIDTYISDTLSVLESDEMKEVFMDALIASAGSEFEPYSAKFEPLVDIIVDAVLNSVSYEITEINDDEVTINLSMIDFTSLDVFADEDAMNALGEDLGVQLIDEGIITEDMTEDEMMEAAVDYIVGAIEEILVDALADAGTTESEVTLKLTEEDGKLVATEI